MCPLWIKLCVLPSKVTHLMAIFLLLILASEAPLKILRRSKRNLGLLYRSHHLLGQPKMLLNCLTPPAPANLLKEGGGIGTHLDIGVAAGLALFRACCAQSQLPFPWGQWF